jgi:hypothetical protein
VRQGAAASKRFSFMALVSIYAAWKPAIVFNNIRAEHSGHPLQDLKRLLRHRPGVVADPKDRHWDRRRPEFGKLSKPCTACPP